MGLLTLESRDSGDDGTASVFVQTQTDTGGATYL